METVCRRIPFRKIQDIITRRLYLEERNVIVPSVVRVVRRKQAFNRPFSKMAAGNSNKSKLKKNTRTRKSTLTLETLPSFRISGKISAEKMYVENCKIYRRLYDYTPSHTNVCKIFNFQHTFSQLIFYLKS